MLSKAINLVEGRDPLPSREDIADLISKCRRGKGRLHALNVAAAAIQWKRSGEEQWHAQTVDCATEPSRPRRISAGPSVIENAIDTFSMADAIQRLARAVEGCGISIACSIDGLSETLGEAIGCHGNKIRLLDHAGQMDIVAKKMEEGISSGLHAIADAIDEMKIP